MTIAVRPRQQARGCGHEELGLGAIVEVRGELVEHDHGGVAQARPGDGQALTLTTAECSPSSPSTVSKPSGSCSTKPGGPRRSAAAHRSARATRPGRRGGCCRHGAGDDGRVLWHPGDAAAPRRHVVAAQRATVDQDGAAGPLRRSAAAAGRRWSCPPARARRGRRSRPRRVRRSSPSERHGRRARVAIADLFELDRRGRGVARGRWHERGRAGQRRPAGPSAPSAATRPRCADTSRPPCPAWYRPARRAERRESSPATSTATARPVPNAESVARSSGS